MLTNRKLPQSIKYAINSFSTPVYLDDRSRLYRFILMLWFCSSDLSITSQVSVQTQNYKIYNIHYLLFQYPSFLGGTFSRPRESEYYNGFCFFHQMTGSSKSPGDVKTFRAPINLRTKITRQECEKKCLHARKKFSWYTIMEALRPWRFHIDWNFKIPQKFWIRSPTRWACKIVKNRLKKDVFSVQKL